MSVPLTARRMLFMGQAVIIQLKLLTQRRSATKPQPKTELTAVKIFAKMSDFELLYCKGAENLRKRAFLTAHRRVTCLPMTKAPLNPCVFASLRLCVEV